MDTAERDGGSPTVQSVVMRWQRTNSEPRAEGPELAEQATEESPSGAHKRCTTVDRWTAGKTRETENATRGERLEEWYMSPRAGDHDAAGGNDSGGAQPQIVERPVPVSQVMVQEVVRESERAIVYEDDREEDILPSDAEPVK